MNSKTLLTVALLLFVVAGLGVMAAKVIRSPGGDETAGGIVGEAGAVDAGAEGSEGAATGAGADPVFLVTYFHGHKRCRTCLTIERLSRATVEESFAPEMAAGTVQYRTLNFEEPGNEHFVGDFALTSQTVVLAEMRGGDTLRWKQLPRVWELTGNEFAFRDYVQTQLSAFMSPDE